MEVQGHAVVKSSLNGGENYVWENPFMQSDRDFCDFHNGGDTLSDEVLKALDDVAVYLPLHISSITIVNAVRTILDRYGDYIKYDEASKWSEEFYPIKTKLAIYDAIWLEREKQNGETDGNAKHSRHGADVVRLIIKELLPVDGRDHFTPYCHVQELCKEYGLKKEFEEYCEEKHMWP